MSLRVDVVSIERNSRKVSRAPANPTQPHFNPQNGTRPANIGRLCPATPSEHHVGDVAESRDWLRALRAACRTKQTLPQNLFDLPSVV